MNEAVREANARAGRIRSGTVEYLATLAEIHAAREARDWETLGYATWAAYVETEFSASRLRLSVEHRQKAIEELRLGGMSQRAIAGTLGVSKTTVARELAGGPNGPREGEQEATAPVSPPAVTGRDGKSYARNKAPKKEPVAAEEPPAAVGLRPEAKEPSEPASAPEPVVERPKAVAKKATSKKKPVADLLAADADVQPAEFMKNFNGALLKAALLYEFDAERVAQLADQGEVESLERHAQLVADFLAEVKSHRPTTKLHLVKDAAS